MKYIERKNNSCVYSLIYKIHIDYYVEAFLDFLRVN